MNNDHAQHGDPIALLRKHYTAEQVRAAYERFDVRAALPLCPCLAEARKDVSEMRFAQMRKTSYFDLPEVLEALGGTRDRSTEYFWPMFDRDPVTHAPIVDLCGQYERLMMLAFMVTWLEDV